MECAEYQRPILFAAESTYVDTGMVGQMVGFTMMQVDASELAVGSHPPRLTSCLPDFIHMIIASSPPHCLLLSYICVVLSKEWVHLEARLNCWC